MNVEFLSLREIGRRLEIPPSSIAYYKDRFVRFIPVASGRGRRTKYPPEAVAIFKEIREMFTRNWSAEQVEEQLATMQNVAHSVASVVTRERGVQAQGEEEGAKEFVQDLSGVLNKMSSVLETQAHFQREMEMLRAEVLAVKKEKAELIAAYEEKIHLLDHELERFRKERADLVGLFLDDYYSATGKQVEPPEHMLGQPLVVCSSGEYLGVVGKDKPFSLQDFVTLVKQGDSELRSQRLAWRREDGTWVLHIVSHEAQSLQREYILHVVHTTTPSGNTVTELRRMVVDGENVPDKFVLMLFKNVKEELEK